MTAEVALEVGEAGRGQDFCGEPQPFEMANVPGLRVVLVGGACM
jgi:hypothetical protein